MPLICRGTAVTTRTHLWKFGVVVCGLVGLTLLDACARSPAALSPQQVRIATGRSSSSRHQLGRALAEIYNARLPNVTASAFESTGSISNIKAVEEGRAEMAFAQADAAYSHFMDNRGRSSTPRRELRALANLFPAALHIVVRGDSGISGMRELMRVPRRIGVSDTGEYSAANLVARAYHAEAHVELQPLAAQETIRGLQRNELDAAFVVSQYQLPEWYDPRGAPDIRLLSIDPEIITRLRLEFPFLRRTDIPAGTYRGQDAEVTSVGVDTLLVCGSDLPEDLVADLMRLFFESVADLSRKSQAPVVDVHVALAAPIPVHPGARRYYRERELFP